MTTHLQKLTPLKLNSLLKIIKPLNMLMVFKLFKITHNIMILIIKGQLDIYVVTLYQELIMCRGEYLTLYSPVIYDCAEVK